MAFGRGGLRPLPWRATRDPWAVLVSEVMLQQTQATRVVEPYHRFLRLFPTARACARAGPAAVLRAWAGLGYNGRARRLHAAAAAIDERHGGAVPDDLDALLALPGVGGYTARAVLVFAFEQDGAVVDVNVGRVLSRAVAGAALRGRPAQELAEALVPPGRAWTWNQAIMEIGATRCTARLPSCSRCPLARCCRWRAGPGPDPAPAVTRQAPFAGSDRQGRGRLVAALREGPVAPDRIAAACGWPDDPGRAGRVAVALVDEGLARRERGGTLRLP